MALAHLYDTEMLWSLEERHLIKLMSDSDEEMRVELTYKGREEARKALACIPTDTLIILVSLLLHEVRVP